MAKKDDKHKKQDLGIFYTPPTVVDFIFEILSIWKDYEDKGMKRWESHKPTPHFPSVIDPACGEGIFLKRAIKSGFTKSGWIFGVDIDEEAVNKWPKISLLEDFGNDRGELEAHFFHQNGLDNIHWEQHKTKYYGKLKKGDIENERFNCVVGNPPYGGVGLEDITPDLEKALFEYKIWKRAVRKGSEKRSDQLGLLGTALKENEKNRLKSFPIEVLFIDRFIQLAKPGGWVAIIIPDGILANSNSHYVREFISEETEVEAIISLPREAFKHVGTSAKTSILFLRKHKEGKRNDREYPVFLASTGSISEGDFKKIAEVYKKFYTNSI